MVIKVRVDLNGGEDISTTYYVENIAEWFSFVKQELENDNEFIQIGSDSLINKCHIVAITFDEMKD
jgi:hypothetical protein